MPHLQFCKWSLLTTFTKWSGQDAICMYPVGLWWYSLHQGYHRWNVPFSYMPESHESLPEGRPKFPKSVLFMWRRFLLHSLSLLPLVALNINLNYQVEGKSNWEQGVKRIHSSLTSGREDLILTNMQFNYYMGLNILICSSSSLIMAKIYSSVVPLFLFFQS